MTRRIRELQWHIKQHLYEFIKKFGIELLIVENALSIPMNIPLGLALTELIARPDFQRSVTIMIFHGNVNDFW